MRIVSLLGYFKSCGIYLKNNLKIVTRSNDRDRDTYADVDASADADADAVGHGCRIQDCISLLFYIRAL